MKPFIKSFLTIIFLSILVISCKKDEKQLIYEKGINPVLTTDNTGTVSLAKVNSANDALTLFWTNPEYVLNTGISSQGVSYNIEMRKHGDNSYVSFAVVNSGLQKTFNQGDINGFLTKDLPSGGLNVPSDKPVVVDIRVTSFLGSQTALNATNLSSAPFTVTFDKPYNIDPDLWVVGDATTAGWTNTPPASQKLAYDRASKTFSITMALSGGSSIEGFKFLTTSGAWQPQWGVPNTSVSPGTLGTFALAVNPGNASDPNAIKVPSNGTYTLVVDLINKKVTISQ
ncbi:MAG: SusE domain-containing protein [Ginsengibacter sp.]